METNERNGKRKGKKRGMEGEREEGKKGGTKRKSKGEGKRFREGSDGRKKRIKEGMKGRDGGRRGMRGGKSVRVVNLSCEANLFPSRFTFNATGKGLFSSLLCRPSFPFPPFPPIPSL